MKVKTYIVGIALIEYTQPMNSFRRLSELHMKNILASAGLSLTMCAAPALADQTPYKKFHLYNTEAAIASAPNGETGFSQTGKGVWETNYGPEKKHYDRSCANQADVIRIEKGIVHTSCEDVAPGMGGSCTIMKQNTSLETAPVGTKVKGEIDCPGVAAQPIDVKLHGNKQLQEYGIIITNPVGGGATVVVYPLRNEAKDQAKALVQANPALTAGLK
jgi:hypothetical protein